MVALGLLFAWQLLPTLLLQRRAAHRPHLRRAVRAAGPAGLQRPAARLRQHPVRRERRLHRPGRPRAGRPRGLGRPGPACSGCGSGRSPCSLFGIVMRPRQPDRPLPADRRNLDLVAEFRVPVRYLLLAYFPLAAAAALGTDALLRRRPRPAARRGPSRASAAGRGRAGCSASPCSSAGTATGAESRRWWALAAAAGARRGGQLRPCPGCAGSALVLLGVTTVVELQQARPAADTTSSSPPSPTTTRAR